MKKITTLLSILYSFSLWAQTTYIHCGQVFDSASGKIKKELTLIIEGEKIKEVVKGYEQPTEGAILIDLKAKQFILALSICTSILKVRAIHPNTLIDIA